MKLSVRQQQILDYIRERIRADGLPPTRAEITRDFGFASPNAAQCHLKALAAKGAIRLTPGAARGIVPNAGPDPEPGEFELPLIGRVAAGQPILAVAHREGCVKLQPGLFSPVPHFLLRVSGDSMIDAGIHDGDLLAVHHTRQARNGQIVVARNGDDVTVKRLRRQREKIWLEAANPRYSDIPIHPGEDWSIEGLGVGVIRRLKD